MPDRAPHFRQRDIERAIKAARKAGERGTVRVEIEGDKLVVVTSEGGETQPLQGRAEWRKRIGALP
jgi:hypothetical protein